MLAESICRKCVLERGVYSTHSTKKDKEQVFQSHWFNGIVLCPVSTSLYTRGEYPPENCHYKLEQMMFQDSLRSSDSEKEMNKILEKFEN